MTGKPYMSPIFDLKGTVPKFENEFGSITDATADNFPVLIGMGASLLKLKKGGIQTPHWHLNSSELNYCISGRARMTIYGIDEASRVSFPICRGQLTFVPKGYWHDIENVEDDDLKIIIIFNNEYPDELNPFEAVRSLTSQVSNSIFGLKSPGIFDELKFNDIRFSRISGDVSQKLKKINDQRDEKTKISNPFTINLDTLEPQVKTIGGTARLGSAPFFPILDGLSVFFLDLYPGGIIEPHIHPNAGELNYVIEGRVRCSVLGPQGDIDTSELVSGQIFFVPEGYFHYLENIDENKYAKVASFFSNANPGFIGLVGGLSSYSNEVMGIMFGKESEFFSSLPRQKKNILIGKRTD